jgi:hypothetical protein
MSTETSLDSRLGDPNQVADAAVLAFRQRTFFGRHPSAKFWVFGVSPILSLFGLFALAFAGMAGIFSAYEKLGFNMHIKRFDPVASELLPYLASSVMVIIPSIVAGVLYCRLARKQHIGKMWMLFSCLLLGFIAMTVVWSVRLSDIAGQSAICCGLPLPSGMVNPYDWLVHWLGQPRQALQFLAPLLVGVWFALRREKHREDQDSQLRLAA